MDESTRIHLTIELIRGSDPIAGALDDGTGTHAFVGWLALVRLLERAAGVDGQDGDDGGDS